MVSGENYEEYMMMYADGELAQEEVRALMAFVAQNPELKAELEAYGKTRLQPDETIVYTEKKTLIKPVPVVTKRAVPIWIEYSIAAGIIALLFVSVLKFVWNGDSVTGQQMARTDSVKELTLPTPKQNAPVVAQAPKPVVERQAVVPEESQTKTKTATVAIARKTKVVTEQAPRSKADASENKKGTEVVLVGNNNELNSIVVAELVAMPNEMSAVKMAVVGDIPEYQPAGEESNKRTLWSLLPIDEMKKKKMEHVAGDLAQAYKEVHTAKQELEDKSLSIRVEKRKILISF